mgnify:FL=1
MQNDITTWKRAARTFGQTAVGFLLTELASGRYHITDWKTWIVAVAASSIAEGIADVMNYKGGK